MSTKIAVTYEDGQVFQHFGRTQQVKIYEIDNGKIVSTQIVDTSEHGHGAMAGYVKGFGATVIICGGLGDGARNSVRDAGLELVNGVSGDADAAVRAYIDGTLVRSGGDCDHHCHHRLHQTESNLLSSSISETSEIVSRSSTEIPEPSRVNYCFFSEELYDLNMAARMKKADRLYREAVSLQNDIDKGKKLKKRYRIGNDLIEARIYLQTKLTRMTGQEARDYILERTIDGREGFFCLTSNLDLNPYAIRKMYRDKDCVEKLFSSMKSDIGIRPIWAWTDDGVYGVLLIGFLAQALIAMTRLLARPADGKATKFISDSMQKLTLTVRRKGMEGTEFILSNFNSLNQAILGAFGVIPEVFRCENTRK